MKETTNTEKEFPMVLRVLTQMQYQLTSKYPPPLIAAASSRRALKQQFLPEHIRIIPKKRQGPRAPVRGRRHHYEPRLRIARWVNDKMLESAVPVFAYIINGSADFQIADYAMCCQTGDCVLFPLDAPRQDGKQSHFEGNPAGRYAEILWMYTSSDIGLACWITCEKGSSSIKMPGEYCCVQHHSLTQLFNAFYAELFHKDRPPIARQLLLTMVMLLCSEIEEDNTLKDWGRPRYQGKAGQSAAIQKALVYIEEYLDKHLTIDKVARQVLLSPTTFTHLFKQETGQTFLEYQTQLRMEVAERLLRTSERPINSICRRIGLKYGQLRTLFQKIHGCSPSEYRRREN